MRRALIILSFLVISFMFSGQAHALLIDNVFTMQYSEDIIAYFDTPGSGTTSNTFNNLVRVEVSGTGLSKNEDLDGPNDAFYFLWEPHDLVGNGGLYLSFTGDARALEADGVDVAGYIKFIDGIGWVSGQKPVYNPSHFYDFIIDIGPTNRNLTLGTGDGGLFDNSGQYNITVSQAEIIPEPSSLSLLGLGLLGFFRRKKSS